MSRRGPNGPKGLRLFYVVVDRREADGTLVRGWPVANACLSLRGARKAQLRVRKRFPDAVVECHTYMAVRS